MNTFSIHLTGQLPEEILAHSMTALEALRHLKVKAIDRVVAVNVNGAPGDLSMEIASQAELEPILIDSEEGTEVLRHSTSHVMAMAVQALFPGAKVTIGPAIQNGFYYDFDYERPFKEDDLPKIEEKMEEIIQADLPFIRKEMTSQEAIDLFKGQGEDYKIEIIEDLGAERVSVYTHGNFTDLCRGPHLPSTGRINAFHLIKVAGAYWRGDEKRAMLSRIYGVAFVDRKKLKEYLKNLEEAQKRNHVKLGPQLELFNTYEEIGSGMIVWHPNGAMLRHILEDFEIREHLKRGYELVRGPGILKTELWKKSGHFENYRENMYFTTIDDQSYGIKPMNCLSHMLIYRSRIRSYRDLPKRYFELGTVYRHERSGVLHGLFRLREFTQDDAHIICTPGQLNDEIKGVLDFVKDVMAIFGFSYELEVSTRPEKSIGEEEEWERATQALIHALKIKNLPYDVNEGEGAFYGPKIDVKLKDALNRRWQCATIQVDFFMPERFDLTYVGSDGERHRPVMLHRVILGAMERFIGVLIEHYAGAFPVWLAPTQAVLMTVTDRQIPYAEGVYHQLIKKGVRVEKDFRNEKLGFKIREAQIQKVPYMLVAGDREVNEGTIAPRKRSGETMNSMSVEDFFKQVESEYPSI